MIRLEVLKDIKHGDVVIHKGSVITIANGGEGNSRLIRAEGKFSGIPEGAMPILSIEDLKTDNFTDNTKVVNNPKILKAKVKVLGRKVMNKIKG